MSVSDICKEDVIFAKEIYGVIQFPSIANSNDFKLVKC